MMLRRVHDAFCVLGEAEDRFSASVLAQMALWFGIVPPLATAQAIALLAEFTWQSASDALLALLAVWIASTGLSNRREQARRDPSDPAVEG